MKPMLSVEQCAERLGMSAQYVRRQLSEGKLRGSKVGRWRVDEADLEAFIERSRPPAADAQVRVEIPIGLEPCRHNPFL